VSGLNLAKSSSPAVTKLIFTSFPTWEHVREAMGLIDTEKPAAVDFVSKLKGFDALPDQVDHAFEKHVGLNWGLEVVWETNDNYSLVRHLDQGFPDEYLLSRIGELDDLFRSLFRHETRVRVERRIWERDGRVALSVFTSDAEGLSHAKIVVCGSPGQIEKEAKAFNDYSPKAAGAMTTTLNATRSTTHFAANVYSVTGHHPERVAPLFDVYRAHPEKTFTSVLKILFEETLADWSQERPVPDNGATVGGSYRELLGLGDADAMTAAVSEQVSSLVRQIPAAGFGVESRGGRLTLWMDGQSHVHPDPAHALGGLAALDLPAARMNTPGGLAGDTVLTDTEERVWVTDFAGAGLAPLLWNFVQLEAVIRFDWLGSTDFRAIYEAERSLVFGNFTRLDASEVAAPLRKPLKAIMSVRQLAARSPGWDPAAYHLGVMLHAVKRLTEFDHARLLLPNELMRPLHLLISAALVCQHLAEGGGPPPSSVGIVINDEQHLVLIDGRPFNLRGHGYRILLALYKQPDQLIEEVFGEKYEEKNHNQAYKLNTAVDRLREKIEEGGGDPRYVVTVKGFGFFLNLP
jgi:hypothetical protein